MLTMAWCCALPAPAAAAVATRPPALPPRAAAGRLARA